MYLNSPRDLRGLRVTIMGLGVHGGGLASALYCLDMGAEVTITDLGDSESLRASLLRLKDRPFRLVLGRHRREDFCETDLVIKNPGVPTDSPFLSIAREAQVAVETDISVFLRLARNPMLAVTGTKGKSTTAAAIHHCLHEHLEDVRLAGNISTSPLSFLPDLDPKVPVVLELSSWQLGDLGDKPLLKPKVALITNIFADHLNRYPSMQEYIADKRQVFRYQGTRDYTVFNYDDPNQSSFPAQTAARSRFFSAKKLPATAEGAWLVPDAGMARIQASCFKILDSELRVLGEHNRFNLLAGGLAALLYGIDAAAIRSSLATFSGLEHRLEYCGEVQGVRFYNDSAATVAEATAQAVDSIAPPLSLVLGGTDKGLDFSALRHRAHVPQQLYLLAGSASKKIISILREEGVDYSGPFTNLKTAVSAAFSNARPGSTVLFSPGCASFEMFQNEFDRGNQYKDIVRRLEHQC